MTSVQKTFHLPFRAQLDGSIDEYENLADAPATANTSAFLSGGVLLSADSDETLADTLSDTAKTEYSPFDSGGISLPTNYAIDSDGDHILGDAPTDKVKPTSSSGSPPIRPIRRGRAVQHSKLTTLFPSPKVSPTMLARVKAKIKPEPESSTTSSPAAALRPHYTSTPIPQHYSSFNNLIYHTTTTSASALSAILDVADRNPQPFELVSVREHLPNDLAAYGEPKRTVHVMFARRFYTDGRAVLGFWVPLQGERGRKPEMTVAQMFFTACTEADLHACGLRTTNPDDSSSAPTDATADSASPRAPRGPQARLLQQGTWVAKPKSDGAAKRVIRGGRKDKHVTLWQMVAQEWAGRMRENMLSARAIAYDLVD